MNDKEIIIQQLLTMTENEIAQFIEYIINSGEFEDIAQGLKGLKESIKQNDAEKISS